MVKNVSPRCVLLLACVSSDVDDEKYKLTNRQAEVTEETQSMTFISLCGQTAAVATRQRVSSEKVVNGRTGVSVTNAQKCVQLND